MCFYAQHTVTDCLMSEDFEFHIHSDPLFHPLLICEKQCESRLLL